MIIGLETPGVYSPSPHIEKVSRECHRWYKNDLEDLKENYSNYGMCIAQVSTDDDVILVNRIIPQIFKIFRISKQKALIMFDIKELIYSTINRYSNKCESYFAPDIIKCKYKNGVEYLETTFYQTITNREEAEKNMRNSYYVICIRTFYKDLDKVIPKLTDLIENIKEETSNFLKYFHENYEIISGINKYNLETTLNRVLLK